MPIYEFRCSKCNNIFEKLFINSQEQVEIKCPQCESEEFERIISATNYAMGPGKGAGSRKPVITTKSCGAENSCSTIELPGPE